MDISSELRDFLNKGYKEYLPHLAIDCAIFGYHERQLKILLIKHKLLGGWCLPGGFILKAEDLIDAANRIVKERTGIDNLYLQEFKTFGNPERSRYDEVTLDSFFKKWGILLEKNSWLLDRFISIGFYAITDFSLAVPSVDFMSDECAWFDVNNCPPTQLDHAQIAKHALEALRIHLYHYPIGYSLLPKKFTLTEIQALYQSVLGKKLDVSNFKKKLLGRGILKKLNEKRNIGPHRAPDLYSFDKKKYDKAIKDGLDLS